ncbi:MAG: hypothetical protein HY928_12480 [Elusimicrobia bacterium]|nr:hypothetical protein [Elusimicrobiota bacterium]
MPRRKLTDAETAARVARLGQTLHLCQRDDAAVVKALHEHQVVDDVEALDKVSFFDEFFTFLTHLKVWPWLEALDPAQRVRASISWAAMVGVYVMRIVLGVPSVPQTEGVILTDPALMTLFELAAFVKTGLTRRGLSRAHVLPEVRGAFSGEAMVDTLVKVSLFAVARTFNAVVKLLAEAGYFPKTVHAVVDYTDCEGTPKFRMLGGVAVASVTRYKRPDHKNNRHAPKVATTVWGWKVWLMFCPLSGIPIAVYVDRINVDDRVWMLALVLQGQANLGERLTTVSFDRGFWDGQELYRVAQQVPFFIPGKADLEITREARRAALEGYARQQQGRPIADAVLATRPILLVTGQGTHRRETRQDLIVIGLKELDCPTYAAEPPGSKVHAKSFVSGRLNAAVVLADPTYPHADPDEPLVILTSAPLESPRDVLFAYDRFDARGVIENSGHKQAKREWTLEAPLEKSEAAVYLHVHVVFLLMGLLAAFRAQQAAEQTAAARGEDTGMARYRRAVERANRDKVLVRDGDCYGILWAWELAVLAGLRLRWYPTETAATILARYGVGPGGSPGPSP